MNDELQTKEYLKTLEHLKLADSSRTRIRENLLSYARFHAVEEMAVPKVVPSPFFSFFMRPAPIALVMVLLVGASVFLLNGDDTAKVAVVDSVDDTTKSVSPESQSQTPIVPTAEDADIETESPVAATDVPVEGSQPEAPVIAMNDDEISTLPDLAMIQSDTESVSTDLALKTSEPTSSTEDNSLFADVTSGDSPLKVTFTVDYFGMGEFEIDFGDGTESEPVFCEQVKEDSDRCMKISPTTHVYEKPGSYLATYAYINPDTGIDETLGSVAIEVK